MPSSPKFSLVRYLVATRRKVTKIASVGVQEAEDLDLNPKPIPSPLTRLLPIYAMETQNHLPVRVVARLTGVMPATRTKNIVGNKNPSWYYDYSSLLCFLQPFNHFKRAYHVLCTMTMITHTHEQRDAQTRDTQKLGSTSTGTHTLTH